MFSLSLSLFADSAFIFVLAFLIDIVFGEYPDRVHPTIGIGKLIAYLKPKLKNPNPKTEKANGVLLALIAMIVVAVPVFLLLFWLRQSFGFYGHVAYIIVGAVLFKATFAVRGMGQYTKPIADALEKNDLAEARRWLPYIVRRDPNTLNERQVTSAAVESIAESTTDGITAPFFFFAVVRRRRRLRLPRHKHAGLDGRLQERGKQKHRLVQRKPRHNNQLHTCAAYGLPDGCRLLPAQGELA